MMRRDNYRHNNFNCISLPILLILSIEIIDPEYKKPLIFMRGLSRTEDATIVRWNPHVRRLTDGGF